MRRWIAHNVQLLDAGAIALAVFVIGVLAQHRTVPAAICGAWLLTLEVGQVVTERELLDEVA